MPRPNLVTINVTPDTRHRLRRVALEMGIDTRGRVTMDEAIAMLCLVAETDVIVMAKLSSMYALSKGIDPDANDDDSNLYISRDESGNVVETQDITPEDDPS